MGHTLKFEVCICPNIPSTSVIPNQYSLQKIYSLTQDFPSGSSQELSLVAISSIAMTRCTSYSWWIFCCWENCCRSYFCCWKDDLWFWKRSCSKCCCCCCCDVRMQGLFMGKLLKVLVSQKFSNIIIIKKFHFATSLQRQHFYNVFLPFCSSVLFELRNIATTLQHDCNVAATSWAHKESLII